VLDTLRARPAPAGPVRLLDADDPDLAAVGAAIHVAFGVGGTAAGPESVTERASPRQEAARRRTPPARR
jgi:hypothetical protein